MSDIVLTCVYCGQAYPEGTPNWGSSVLTDHIKICDKHPIRKVESERKRFRVALVRLIQTDDIKELEGIKEIMKLNPNIGDREDTVNAIQALIDIRE